MPARQAAPSQRKRRTWAPAPPPIPPGPLHFFALAQSPVLCPFLLCAPCQLFTLFPASFRVHCPTCLRPHACAWFRICQLFFAPDSSPLAIKPRQPLHRKNLYQAPCPLIFPRHLPIDVFTHQGHLCSPALNPASLARRPFAFVLLLVRASALVSTRIPYHGSFFTQSFQSPVAACAAAGGLLGSCCRFGTTSCPWAASLANSDAPVLRLVAKKVYL